MGIGIEDKEQKCYECGRVCKNRRSLGMHLARSHPEVGGLKAYVLKHVVDNVPPCRCGCGTPVTWHPINYAFNDYVNGHNCAGFRAKQPTFTQEQIDRRNESIRRAYRSIDKGREIRT